MSFWQRETKVRDGAADLTIQQLFRLDNRAVVVTGGSGAVALAAVEAVAQSGSDVILLDTREAPDHVKAKLDALVIEHEVKVLFKVCDVTDESSVTKALEDALAIVDSPLRGLVCCAGISGDGSSLDWPLEEWRKIHDVNVLGTFICAREAARQMQRQRVGAGSIVLIASMSGHGANKGVDTTAYNASKAAVQQIARSLASEWGSNVSMPSIRVNSISPGYIQTRLTEETLERPGIKDLWESDNMLKRISTVDEYRGPVVFLLSDASSFITGTDLRVDGGHTAW